MYEVVMHENGMDIAVAPVDDLIDATAEAIKMFSHGWCPALRKDGVIINNWLGTAWQHPIQPAQPAAKEFKLPEPCFNYRAGRNFGRGRKAKLKSTT